MIVGYAHLTNNLKIISLFIYGLSLLSYVIYIRLILKRLPRDLILVSYDGNTIIITDILIIIILIQLIFFSIGLYITLKKVFNIPFSTEGKLKQYLLPKIQRLFRITDTAFGVVFSKCMHLFTKDPFEFMTPIITKFFDLFGNKLWVFIVLTQGIRFIIIISFLIDIFMFFEFHYFYQSLSLFIIPLLISAWFFNIDEWQQVARNSKNEFKYKVVNRNLPNERTDFLNVYKLDKEYFQYCIDIYIKCITFYDIQQKYEKLKEYWDIRVNLIYYTLYLIGIIYIIIKNISF